MQNYESNELENPPSPYINQDVSPVAPELIAPNNPPWNSLAAIGVWIASIIFIIVFPNIFLLPYLSKQSINFADRAAILEFAQTDAMAILLQLISVIPAHIFTLILSWLVVTRIRKYSFRTMLGWRWNGFNIWTCIIIVGGFYILSGAILYLLPEQENDLIRILKSSRNAVYVVSFLATFTAPLVEEVVYRGILYSAFQRSAGVPAAVLITSVLFASIHFFQYWGSPGTIILICILSLVLTLLRARTGNLLPCIALHTVLNGSQSLLMILQPYLEKYLENNPPPTDAFFHFFK